MSWSCSRLRVSKASELPVFPLTGDTVPSCNVPGNSMEHQVYQAAEDVSGKPAG
jgi:hypothetical protein